MKPVPGLMAVFICLPDSFHIQEKSGPPSWDPQPRALRTTVASQVVPPPWAFCYPQPSFQGITFQRHHSHPVTHFQNSPAFLVAVGSSPPSSHWRSRGPLGTRLSPHHTPALWDSPGINCRALLRMQHDGVRHPGSEPAFLGIGNITVFMWKALRE